MGVCQGEEFKKARQNGAFADVDFLASNFTGHKLQYRYKVKSGKWFTKKYICSQEIKKYNY